MKLRQYSKINQSASVIFSVRNKKPAHATTSASERTFINLMFAYFLSKNVIYFIEELGDIWCLDNLSGLD